MTEFELEIASGPAPAVASFPQASAWLDGNGTVCARVFRDGQRRWIDCETIGLFSMSERQTSVGVWPASGVTTSAVQDFFNRRLKPLLFQARGYQTLHASAVRFEPGVVAISGNSGSGKSTLAYALHLAGHPQVADDALVIDVEMSPPGVRALPFRPQLKGEAGFLVGATSLDSGAGLDSHFMPLAAIVLISQNVQAPMEPTASRLTGPAACVAVLSHAHVFDATEDPGRLVTAYANLVNVVPVYRLTYRPDMSHLPRLVRSVERLLKP